MVTDVEYIIPISSSSEISDNIYDTIQEPVSETMSDSDISLPDQCKQRSFFIGTMCRDVDLQNASKYNGSNPSLVTSSKSSCSTYSVVSNTNKFLYLYKLLKGLMHEYADILLEQSEIDLKCTQLPAEEEINQSIKDCSDPSQNNVSINDDNKDIRDNLSNDYTDYNLSFDLAPEADAALCDTTTPAQTGQKQTADMEDLVAVQNMIHDELKKAWEYLAARLDCKLITEIQESEQQSVRGQEKEVKKENTAPARLSGLNFEYKDDAGKSQYVLGRIPASEKDLDIKSQEHV